MKVVRGEMEREVWVVRGEGSEGRDGEMKCWEGWRPERWGGEW